MEKQDLRVKKTLQRIEDALMELLEKKPLEKVTITELAKVAEINKGTFYLHYTDIYDLYKQTLMKYMFKPLEDEELFSDFFSDPEAFLDRLNEVLTLNLPPVEKITQMKRARVDYNMFVRYLCDKVYETCKITRTVENDLKLMSIFGSLSMINLQYHGKHYDLTKTMTASMIRYYFPSETKSHQ